MSSQRNDQPSKYEAVRKQYEGSGGFDILRLRFTIIRDSLGFVENSPTIARAIDNARRLEAAAEKLRYNEEIDRLAEVAQLEAAYSMPSAESKLDSEVAELEAIPTQSSIDEVSAQGQMAEQARSLISDTHNIPDSHNYELPK